MFFLCFLLWWNARSTGCAAWPGGSSQFRGVKDGHVAVQPAPHPRLGLSCLPQMKLRPRRSCPSPLPRPGDQPAFHLQECDCSGDRRSVEPRSDPLSVAGLFHSARCPRGAPVCRHVGDSSPSPAERHATVGTDRASSPARLPRTPAWLPQGSTEEETAPTSARLPPLGPSAHAPEVGVAWSLCVWLSRTCQALMHGGCGILSLLKQWMGL